MQLHNDEHNASEFYTTVTQRSQVTLPASVRRMLGIKARDKVVFAVEDDQVLLRPATFTLESLAGSIKPLSRPGDIEEQIREAKEEKAERERREQSRR